MYQLFLLPSGVLPQNPTDVQHPHEIHNTLDASLDPAWNGEHEFVCVCVCVCVMYIDWEKRNTKYLLDCMLMNHLAGGIEAAEEGKGEERY